jgi:hypothetical protein
MRSRLCFLGHATLLFALLGLLLPVATADEPRVLSLWFHLAEREGKPVAADTFLSEQLAHVNQVFESVGVRFVEGGRSRIDMRHARLVTRSDRDALAPYVKRGFVNCMVVGTLMDVDEDNRERRGVHWHTLDPARHFVILSAISGPYVLAHELGHFFGNPRHSDTAGNLMSYERTEAVPFLDEPQRTRVQRTVTRLLKTGELRQP